MPTPSANTSAKLNKLPQLLKSKHDGRIILFLLLLPLLLNLPSCKKEHHPSQETRLEVQRPLMGTLFRVVTYATDHPSARAEIDLAFDQAEALAHLASDYEPDSELNQLCRAPHGHPIKVSPLLYDLLREAKNIARLTEGAYDPTLGPLTHLWRQSRRTGELPNPQDLTQAKSRCGHQHLTLNPAQQTITLNRPQMQLDLGGIAKGYTADLIWNHLSEKGYPRTLVAAGGDLRLGKEPPEKEGWTVAPKYQQGKISAPLILKHCAISTSGDLHQKIIIDGQTYSHLIDPATGLGLTTPHAATVIGPTATQTDPLATAACLMKHPQQFFQKLPSITLKSWHPSREKSTQKR